MLTLNERSLDLEYIRLDHVHVQKHRLKAGSDKISRGSLCDTLDAGDTDDPDRDLASCEASASQVARSLLIRRLQCLRLGSKRNRAMSSALVVLPGPLVSYTGAIDPYF